MSFSQGPEYFGMLMASIWFFIFEMEMDSNVERKVEQHRGNPQIPSPPIIFALSLDAI